VAEERKGDTDPGGSGTGAGRDPLAEETLESRIAYDGAFFRIVHDKVRCPDGHVGVREFMRHPGAVMVAALTEGNEVVLERQFRYPLQRSFIEMPAGKLEEGESPLACGQRELQEETGYRAAHWDFLGAFHNAIGYSNEQISVYLARGLEYVGGNSDAGEVLEVFTAPLDDLLEWIARGRVTDGKTIIGAYWLQRALARAP
jgi:ADP-ribose pyrophosphatase